jgi:hypothetical protein
LEEIFKARPDLFENVSHKSILLRKIKLDVSSEEKDVVKDLLTLLRKDGLSEVEGKLLIDCFWTDHPLLL